MIFRLAIRSLLNRRFSAAVCIIMVALSTLALLAVDTVYRGTQSAFGRSVQGIDLIVGAPTGDINLLLFSAFHVGAPSRALSWQSFTHWREADGVSSAVPLMLGDSHRGFRVIGTDSSLFDYLKQQHSNTPFAEGETFTHVFDITLGHEVARKLDYQLGDQLTLSHGLGTRSFQQHKDRSFTVTGILALTGTPIDKTLQISTDAIEAIHWTPAKLATLAVQPMIGEVNALQPESLSAFYLTLDSKFKTFQVQRAINQNNTEPMQAILPGVAITQLWAMLDWVEAALLSLGLLAAILAAIGVSMALLGHLDRRIAEFQLLQILGARRRFIFSLLGFEAAALVVAGMLLGTTLTIGLERVLSSVAQNHWGLYWPLDINSTAIAVAGTIVPLASGVLVSAVGAWRLGRHG